jgi:hypothetical protein
MPCKPPLLLPWGVHRVLLLLLTICFLNVPLIADWQAVARTCEYHVNDNLRCADRKQRQYDYTLGQQVLTKVHNPTKLGVRMEGPYTIERVHINGNLTILLREGITERINIRRVLPYC